MFLWRTGRDPRWAEFDRLRNEMGTLFNLMGSERRTWPHPLWSETRLFPMLNVTEMPDSFVVTAEIPGITTDDLEINIEADTLTLKGERKPEPVEKEASYHRKERSTGAFQRSITLPAKVDSEKVSASYKNGVLTITLYKEKAAAARQITIKAE